MARLARTSQRNHTSATDAQITVGIGRKTRVLIRPFFPPGVWRHSHFIISDKASFYRSVAPNVAKEQILGRY
jgi:hypothetical protein